MSAINVSVQELSYLFTDTYCVLAVCALLVYDWLLCLSQEVRFIWNWRSRGVTVSSLVYAFSRYAFLIENLLSIATTYPMSDVSCRANAWTQVAMEILGVVALSAFSALRAYALSNRSIWLAAIILLLALPPVVMRIVEWSYLVPENLPSPLNCSNSSSLPPTLSVSVIAILRGSQFVAELLVAGITWWYTYQSYRIRKGIKLGKTLSSLLFYNGSMYFLFLATLCILDIIFGISVFPLEVVDAARFLEAFVDPLASIITCHFMLSLRQFDSTIASMNDSGLGPRVREHMASTVLEFGAQPSDSLPALIASFAHPVHVDTTLSETVLPPDAIVEGAGSEWREMSDVAVAPNLGTPSGQSPARDQTSGLEPWVTV